jgi:hypothetical protein
MSLSSSKTAKSQPPDNNYLPSLSSTFFVMRTTCASLPWRPWDQSVVAAVKTVPVFV